jgi:hypothetical protein
MGAEWQGYVVKYSRVPTDIRRTRFDGVTVVVFGAVDSDMKEHERGLTGGQMGLQMRAVHLPSKAVRRRCIEATSLPRIIHGSRIDSLQSNVAMLPFAIEI